MYAPGAMSTSTFSYAQAAKGHLPTQVTTSQQTSNQPQTTSVAGSSNRDVNTTNTSTRTPSVAVSASSNDMDSRSARSTSVDPEASRPNGVESSADEVNTAIPVGESIDSSRTATYTISAEGSAKDVVPRGRPMAIGSETGENFDGKKNKKPKKGKYAEKEGETEKELEKEVPPPKIELSEAPLPSVNVWVQRQQAAKVKSTDHPASSVAIPAQIPTDSKLRPSHNEATEGSRAPFNGRQGSRRESETPRTSATQGPKRVGPRGIRGSEREPETNLLANNPASWPTPETAAVNLKTQPQGQPEKEEKEDTGTSKPKQKKEWVQLPNFVPTVKWETAMPSRGPRGGRASGVRGGRDAAASPHVATNSTDRVQDSSTAPRTSTGSRRAPIEGSGPREGRKNTAHPEHSKLPKESTTGNTNGEHHKPNQTGVVNGTNHDQPGAAAPAQYFAENGKVFDSHKDIRNQNTRDAHPPAQNGVNHRSGERPRGGGRGRGGGGYNQNNLNGMSHYNQNPYTAQHQAYQIQANGSRHAPQYGPSFQSMPHSFSGQIGSGQRKSTSGSRRQGNGRVPSIPPMNISYDASIYPAPNPGVYSYDASNILQLAQSQVEYYFSTENCVKDWYLRQHMDSQGFVPINFIASFNRMRELLVDINILRQACALSEVLEFVVGNDGVERVRSKDGWSKWVIHDMSERDATARHNGPSTWQPFNGFPHPMMSPHYAVDATQVFSPTSEHGFAHYPNNAYGIPPLNVHTLNGVNGHNRPHESQLSAAVPEFSPSVKSSFNGPKSTSQNPPKEANIPADATSTGVDSPHEQFQPVANGAVHDQPQTNGIHLTNQSEGY